LVRAACNYAAVVLLKIRTTIDGASERRFRFLIFIRIVKICLYLGELSVQIGGLKLSKELNGKIVRFRSGRVRDRVRVSDN